MGVTQSFTMPYTAAESFIYDRLIAPAVVEMKDEVASRLIARVPEGGRALEVGCGGGQLAVDLATRRPDVSYTGLDLSNEQIGRARARGAALAPRLSFVQGSALDLPFEDGRFDVVISVASIKHWPDPARGLSECARVLAPGGLLAVVEADRGCTLDDASRFVSRWRIPSPLRPVALTLFRTYVAGRSLDLDDARDLVRPLPFASADVRRIPGTPALMIEATRA
jgi:ubiquinone/menaquinone biosynthesis C-methylase UbiE